MTVYYPDISSFQAGIDLKGALAVCCKSTQGTGYTNPDYSRAKANAARHGAFFFAYNFLMGSNAGASPAAQAAYCRKVTGGVPLMLDPRPGTPAGAAIRSAEQLAVAPRAEPAGVSMPSLADMTGFVDAYRKAGGTCWLVYLPRWYWQQIGSPSLKPLADRGLLLVSSAYTTYTDASSGTGWQPYGGMTPVIWQYTDALSFNGYSVDFNAYRGTHPGDQSPAAVAETVKELVAIVTTGRLPAAPPPPTGPFRHQVGANNTASLDSFARGRGTTQDALVKLSTPILNAPNLAIMTAYLALDGVLAAAGHPHPAMPEGMVFWTVNP